MRIRGSGLPAAGVVLALALLVSACGGASPGIEYKDPEDRALFVIPDDWNLYEPDELISAAA